ncbi:hypothetical protein [Natronincola ferrireducens]|uniref:Uncharacterized protein n=1 Tax=Natronincola ferrireducens TaxID=393762 RepID=A0A1G9IIT3_9FIRM|nr:hypothetical protein [Natronincola ferrireducens]SDL24813.1 hypothetical protein SAMN05660472_02878 [Natronincola ferrireducens]
MRNLKLEIEAIQISIYCDIIIHILKKHKELSISKLLVFSYLIKKERFIPSKVYNGNNTQDIVCKCISLLAGDYDEYCNSIQYIIKAIHLLITDKVLQLRNNHLHCKTDIKVKKTLYDENIFMEKAIEASKNMTDRQFLKEVMYNV